MTHVGIVCILLFEGRKRAPTTLAIMRHIHHPSLHKHQALHGMLSRQWRRYALSVQYHGGNALGFSYQGPKGENCLVYEPRSNNTIIQADLRGLESIEGRIRRALNYLVGKDNYQNIQVSSRTDRGVHAWSNTFQVDIRPRLAKVGAQIEISDGPGNADRLKPQSLSPKNLVHGLNFYLSRLTSYPERDECDTKIQNSFRNQTRQCNNTIRILSAGMAPSTRVPNPSYDPNLPQDADNPINLPWDIRFTATRRTYAYRILHSFDTEDGHCENDEVYSTATYHSFPFEDDRVWRIHEKRPDHLRSKKSPRRNTLSLDIDSMNLAGEYLTGTHDFTSFRGKGCQRSSPIVTIESIKCYTDNYHGEFGEGLLNAALRRQEPYAMSDHDTLQLVTIVITGNSFVYHQVRNMVACLVEVGQGKKSAEDIKTILDKKDRSCAVGMAPPQGLFLVDVDHGDFKF